MGDTKGSKPGVFRWGGILASRGRVVQTMVFVAVSVATIAFAFAQLGLVGLGEPNEGMTYAVVQLVPVAIAALLFGPLGGALLGLIAGAALLVHSHVQPLDFFEVYFITPVSSCVLLLAAGFVLGLMFAAALRRDPSAGRRAAGIVADPIDRVNRALERIAEGDLATRTDEGSSRELASLSEGVNTMTVALEKQFAQIKEGIKRELDAAAVIQESALPRAFPPFPDIPRFDIYAGMQPAREVGGDFYDFFLIGDACDAESGKLGFVVADVSGKGVPAALFMMAAKTAIRGYMESGMELGEAFENANRKLCAGNDSAMFVTAFAGVLDYATGSVSCTYSAEPPSITVEIEDEGIPFDPLSRPDAVTPTSIEDVPIGGLGILMAKRSVDEMRYERPDGANVVTIAKRW